MRAILDEGVPRKIIPELRNQGCSVTAFPNGWKGQRNGTLLENLERAGFECLITCDKNMEWQTPLAARNVALVVLPSQKLADLLPIIDRIADGIGRARPGQITRIGHRRPAGND